MLRAHLRNKDRNEYGFTLIELLVVILIIGILAAIAIPAFLNQRQRANDAAVESDIRNVAVQVETLLVEVPNANDYAGQSYTMDDDGAMVTGNEITVTVSDSSYKTASATVKLSPGVTVIVTRTNIPVENGPGDDYIIQGFHDNGKDYNKTNRTFALYSSLLGGFTTMDELIAAIT